MAFDYSAVARVVIEHLTKYFSGARGEDVHALDDLSLTVEEGELLVLVGPSGCGKTTALRLIAGLEEPSSGTISLDGRVVNRDLPKDRDVAMVFQNPALYPHMTVYDNLGFGLKLRRHHRTEIGQRVKEAAEMLGLQECLGRRPMELSGGQRQRVALGRALVSRPKLFLLDEPLSNLDPQLRAQMRMEVSRLHARLATTMLYVTHDQTEALTLGNRVAVLDRGHLQQLGQPLQLYQRPANLFVARFIGSPPMNLFHGTLARKADALFFQEDAVAPHAASDCLSLRLEVDLALRLEAFAERKIVFGVRPEHIVQQAPGAPAGLVIEATVELIESLGPESYVHLRSGPRSFVARVSGAPSIKPGQKLQFGFQIQQAHFFDPATQRAI